MRLSFLTSSALPALYSDDLLAADVLTARGHEIVPTVWDKTTITALNGFDAVVMRSPWDWYQRPLEFEAFLERLGQLAVPLFNPHSMLLDFYDKTYLRGLEERGVPIVPTRWVTRDALETLPDLIRAAGWSRAVIKPTVSANSSSTHLFSASDARKVMASLRQKDHHAYLVQPYLDEIEHDGEWSFVFFGGVYSHAVRKYPKLGDFRVQHDHGGRVEPHAANPELISQATEVVRRGVPGSLYARVDGVVRDDQLLLMELEVIEPELFFRTDPDAADRFADALIRSLSAG